MNLIEQAWARFGDRVCWYPKQSRYYFRADRQWTDTGNEKNFRDELAYEGLYDQITRLEGDIGEEIKDKLYKKECTELLSEFMIWSRRRSSIHWVGEMGGRKAGLHDFGGRKCLLLRGPHIIKGVEGDCSFILSIIESLLPGDQAPRFLAWLKRAYLSLKNQALAAGQAVIIAGMSGNGKTLTQQQIITPVLGGRSGDAIKFLTGQTGFNGDLGSADHWLVDDQGESVGFNRQVFSDAIKKIVADPWARIEAKGADAITAPLLRRLSIVMNTGSKNMSLLPELSEDIKDKLLVFKSAKVLGLDEEQEQNNRVIREQLPAFIHWLEGHEPPSEVIGDLRFGTHAFFHPELKKELHTTSAAAQIYPLITQLAAMYGNEGVYEATSQEIHRLLLEHSGTARYLEKIVKSVAHFGRALTEISRCYPVTVMKRETDRGATYKITLTPEMLTDQSRKMTTLLS